MPCLSYISPNIVLYTVQDLVASYLLKYRMTKNFFIYVTPPLWNTLELVGSFKDL